MLRPRTKRPFNAPISTVSWASVGVNIPEQRKTSTNKTPMAPSTFKIKFGF